MVSDDPECSHAIDTHGTLWNDTGIAPELASSGSRFSTVLWKLPHGGSAGIRDTSVPLSQRHVPVPAHLISWRAKTQSKLAHDTTKAMKFHRDTGHKQAPYSVQKQYTQLSTTEPLRVACWTSPAVVRQSSQRHPIEHNLFPATSRIRQVRVVRELEDTRKSRSRVQW